MEHLGMTGVRVDSPVVQEGDFFFVYTIDAEDDTEEDRFSTFYWIESVNKGIATYREHSVDTHYHCLRDDIYRTSIKNLIDRIDVTCWYRINGCIYFAAAKKIGAVSNK